MLSTAYGDFSNSSNCGFRSMRSTMSFSIGSSRPKPIRFATYWRNARSCFSLEYRFRFAVEMPAVVERERAWSRERDRQPGDTEDEGVLVPAACDEEAVLDVHTHCGNKHNGKGGAAADRVRSACARRRPPPVSTSCRLLKLREILNLVPETMLQNTFHAIRFKCILILDDGHPRARRRAV